MILLDHCVPGKFRPFLRQQGYEAVFLQELHPPDSSDPEVINAVQELDAVLLTVDMDFASILNYPPQLYQGIVVVRYQAADESSTFATLKRALADLYREELRGTLVVITSDRYRVRRG